MAGKLIEIIVLLLGLLITAAIVVKIPLDSYNEYKDYLAQIEEQAKENAQAAIKPKLESITVELKDGVKFYANDMADAKAEHFIVTANYIKGEEKYSETVEEGKFTVNTVSDFYSHGGEVTITFKGMSAKLNIELEPVVVDSLKVLSAPYTIKYAQGSTFDISGMVIQAVYNDGSSKIITSDEYVVDTQTLLTTADNKVTVSYQIGDILQTVDIEIGVSETLDNGNVESIAIHNALVNAGDTLDKSQIAVVAVYKNGNRKPLTAEEYTISGSTEAVTFGKAYELTVTYNADSTKTAKSMVTVRQTIQGENGVIVGGSKNTETEYVIINGVITETTNKVSFAGGFSKAVLDGKEASLTLVLDSATKTVGNITMRCGNSYNVYANGSDKTGGYMMKPLQINTILDLTVNGREVRVPATVVLKGCGPWESYAPLYGIYYEFTFEGIELDAGVNKVEFHFKRSTVGATNCWGESPSTLNIDYVNFDTIGNSIPDEYSITDLEISSLYAPQYAEKVADLKVPVIATLDNGTKIAIDYDLYDISVEGNPDMILFGTYTITATLKSDPSVKASIDVTIEEFEEFVVLHAGVELINGRVYYVFSGNSVGITSDDLKFFDKAVNFDFTCEFTATTFVLKIDVTDYEASDFEGGTIYPHLKVNEMNYDNGANGNGDIRGRGLTFTEGQSVTLNGKTYTIKKAWEMPILVIS